MPIPYNFKRDPENRFKGLVFSYETGEELYRRTRIDGTEEKVLKYLYRIERFDGTLNKKEPLFIMEKDIDERISSDISKVIKSITNKTNFTKRIREKYAKAIEFYKEKIGNLDGSIEKEEYALQKSYERYSLGKIDRDTYLLERDISQGRISTIEKEKIAYENYISDIKQDRKKALSWIKALFSAKGLDKLSSELIEVLVEKIIVYETHQFEVIYKFNMGSLKEDKNE